ncbi:MAG: signal peptidase I [Deltaproteobacteria bacterium]
MAKKEDKEKNMGKTVQGKSQVREWVESIAIALILALFVRTFVVQAFKIPSGSMEPTLLIGDHLLVNKFLYGTKIPFTEIKVLPIREPERGDVVVFVYPVDPSKDFIKRAIGLPGDKVEVRNKKVYVNDTAIPDPYAHFADDMILLRGNDPRDNFGPVTVPPDSLFVMGDNRDRSYDSRFWGFVRKSEIKGKAFILYWSWDSNRFLPRLLRIGNLIY